MGSIPMVPDRVLKQQPTSPSLDKPLALFLGSKESSGEIYFDFRAMIKFWLESLLAALRNREDFIESTAISGSKGAKKLYTLLIFVQYTYLTYLSPLAFMRIHKEQRRYSIKRKVSNPQKLLQIHFLRVSAKMLAAPKTLAINGA